MTDGLYLVAEEFAAGGIEAVELCIDIQRDIPVIDVVEARHRVGHLLLVLLVPVLLRPSEEHTVCEVETGGDIHIAQSREGGLDGDAVLDAVLPVLGQTGVQDPVFLHVVDLVLEVTRILHRDLLIPPGRSRRLLPFEGIELGDVDGKRRQFHTERRVAHVLRDVERRVDCHADAGESRVETHGRGTRRLRPRGGVIHRSEVVGVVGRRRVVHAGIERAVGIGLCVLRVVPRQFEVRRQQVVGHVLLTPDGVLVADEEVTAETVALLIVRCGGHAPRALCIDLTQQLQVHLVADSEIVAAVTQIETLIRLVTVGRHDQSAGVALREGEEAVGHG